MGVTRLLDHVAKRWQPSWYNFAGVLLPYHLDSYDHSLTAKPQVKEQRSTDVRSKTSLPLGVANTAPTEVHSNIYTNPPSPLRPVLLPIPFSDVAAHSSNPRGTSTSVVEENDELHSPVTLQSGKQESTTIINSEDVPRPRRQARDKAMAKIRQAQGQPKKRPRSSGSNISPAAKRRKAPANSASQHTEARMEAEDEQDKTEVESTLTAHDEVIPPIKSTPILYLARSLTILTCILLVPANRTCVTDDTHPSTGTRASISVEVLSDPPKQHVKSSLECEPSDKALAKDEEGLGAALRKRNALAKDIALTEAHIEYLRDALDKWSALTDTARKILGPYNTQDDIVRTLNRQEVALSVLKTDINCIQYKIEGFRRGENLIRAPTCIV